MSDYIHEKCFKQISGLQLDIKYWKEFGAFFLGEYCKANDVVLYEGWLIFEEWYDDKYSQNNNG